MAKDQEKVEINVILEHNEETYRFLIENSLVGVNIVDLEENLIFSNQFFADMVGYSRSELIGMNLSALFSEEDYQKLRNYTIRRKENKQDTYELRLIRKDGQEIVALLNAIPFRDKNGIVIGASGIIVDITERVFAQERYGRLFENIADPIIIYDLKGNILDVNPETCSLFEYSKVLLLNMNIFDLTAPKHVESFLNELNRLQQMHNLIFETRIITKTGKELIFEVNASVIRIGKMAQIFAIHRNITNFRIAEQEQLKIDKLNSLGILAGGIAHDFNNFLMAISGNLQLAQLDSDNAGYLEAMGRAIDRATSLSQKLLTFSKGGAPVKKTASIEEIVRETADFILEGSSVAPRYIIESKLWACVVDVGQISQVIQNLVENAKQAMPNGGNIDITIKNFVMDQHSFLPLSDGKYIYFAIIDHGCGIPANIVNKIFDPYFTTKPDGHGLGLSITHSIIQKHSGHIQVSSIEGEGTIFHVYLPATNEIAQKTDRNSKFATVYGNNERILVMDDDNSITIALKSVLQRYNYQIISAYNGNEAVELYQTYIDMNTPFKLVILDLTIPGKMGGLETLKKLREVDPHVKAIVSSGYSTNPIMGNPQKYGFVAAIAKPYKFDNLLHVISNILKLN